MSDDMRGRVLELFEMSEARLAELEQWLEDNPRGVERLDKTVRMAMESTRNEVLRELLGKDSRADERRAAEEATDG